MMATSGTISLGGTTVSRSVNLELGYSATAQLDINNPNARNLAGVPTDSSTISMSNFYGRLAFMRGAKSPLAWYLWNVHAASADGRIVYLVDGNYDLYKSTNYGFNVSYISGVWGCYSIDCSADGTIVVYASYNDGIYVSTNSGASFTLRLNSTLKFVDCSCSASGALMVACTQNTTTATQLYVSTNYGTNWTARGPSITKWNAVVCSGASTYMYALNSGNGYIYRSTDSGTNWAVVRTRIANSFVACSSNGSIVWTLDSQDYATRGIAKSTDYGVNWTINGPYQSKFTPVRCSGDGNKIAVDRSAMTWDGGATWQSYPDLDIGANIQYSVTRNGNIAFAPYRAESETIGAELGIAYLP